MTVVYDKPVTCPDLIGRTNELVALNSFIDLARSGHGQIAIIRGEAGIGKSSLVARAKSFALTHGFLLLEGDCFQTEAAYPYGPLLDLLRAFFTIHLDVLQEIQQDPLVYELIRFFPDLAIYFPSLVQVDRPQTLDPEQQKHRLFAVVSRFVNNLAKNQPVLLIIEDLHWCDDNSLELLLHLVRRGRAHPLFFLFTYRSEEISPGLSHWLAQLDREHPALEIALGRLSQAEVEAMLQAIFAMPRPLKPELLKTLYNLTDGNPFFVEEILKSLLSTGELQFIDGAWERRFGQPGPDGSFGVPRSVEDAVRRRTERLSFGAKKVLSLAAVAGRRFDFSLLQEVLRYDEDQLLALTKELVAAQLVIEVSAEQYAFRHALGQQAVYRSLLARERRQLHLKVAKAVETQIESSPGKVHLADLANHFYAGGDWEKALEYGQRAGEEALALFAPSAAIELLTLALDAVHHLSQALPASVYYARGQAYAIHGEFDQARQDYEQALESAHNISNGLLEWQSMMALGLLWAGRDYTEAGAWFRQASELAAQHSDPALLARSLNRLGNWLLNTGSIAEGFQAHQKALGIFEAQHNAQGMAETFDLLGITYGMQGDRVKAVDLLGQAIAMFRTSGDSQGLVSSLAMRALQSMPGASATTFYPMRERDACVGDAAESLQLAQQTDSLAGQAFAENALAHTLLSFGELCPALSHAHKTQYIAAEIEHQQWMAAGYHCFGRIYLYLLAPALAITALETGRKLAQELGSSFWLATLTADLGLAYIMKHDLLEARAVLQTVMPSDQQPRNVAERDIALTWGELALAQDAPGVALKTAEQLLTSAPGMAPGQVVQPIPNLLKLKGEALMALSHQEEAAEALEAARRGAEERNARPLLWTIHRSLGRCYHNLRRKDKAREAYAAARQLIRELAATIDDISLRLQFESSALASLPEEKPQSSREAARQRYGGLTNREREVAVLVAQGKTSREIAALLVVSERTAEVHVGNILRKLGFSSRAQIAAWVVETGLVKH